MPQIEDIESTTTSTSWWDYASTFLKGVGILVVGGLGYLGWRSYNQQTSVSITNTNSVQDALSVQSESQVENIFSEQSINFKENLDLSYRPKRATTSSSQTPIGVEFQVNTFTMANQKQPVIATLSNGNMVIVWMGEAKDGDREGVFGQVFDPYGNKIGSEFQVNTHWIDAQRLPDITALNNTGGFMVVWQSYGQDGWSLGVFGQQFDSEGNKGNYTEFQANTYTPYDQVPGNVAALPNGRLLVAWSSLGQAQAGYNTVYGQLFDGSTRVGSEFAISSTNPLEDATYTYSLIALPSSNQFVLAWNVGNGGLDPSSPGAEARLINGQGNLVGSRFLLNTYTTGYQSYPKLAALVSGGFLGTWFSQNQVSASSGYDIYAQRFDASANKVGSEFLVNTYTIGNQHDPVAIGLSNGSFLIAWHSSLQDDGKTYGVFAQWFDANGVKLGREFQVNVYTQDDQMYPRMTCLLNNDIVITWRSWEQDGSDYGVFARVLTPSLLPFIYNLDIPQQYFQNTPYLLQNLVVNPMVDANVVNVALAIDPSKGSLNMPSSSTFYYGSASSTYDADTGTWFVSGAVVPVNNVLSNLTFTPVAYGFDDFTISFSVVDGVHTSFNGMLLMQGLQVPYPPILQTQNFVVDQGTPQILTFNYFNASNPDPQVTRSLTFAFDQVLQASFVDIETGQGVFNVTDAQINQRSIQLTPDDSGFPVSFKVTASDGISTSLTLPANITFNQRPSITKNVFTVLSNSELILSSNNLNGTDDHTLWSDLVWQLSNAQHVTFKGAELSNGIYRFTNGQIMNGNIVLVPDGSSSSPSFNVNLLDERNLGLKQTVASVINFQSKDNNKSSNTNLAIGLGVGLGAGALLTAGALTFGIFAYRQHKKAKADAAERARYPLANALYEILKVQGAENFASSKGLEFVNAVDALNAELKKTGIDSAQMIAEEQEELAEKLARAIKANVTFEPVGKGVKLNALDIQDRAYEIVKTAKSLGKFTYQDDQTVEMVNFKKH